MRTQFYRPEIDGLRALAVIPVVLYHLGVGMFSGGYVGVDIFFVVSGYLITQIITRHIDEQGFSIVQFYERRVRRIAPALSLVLLFSWVMAILLFLPSDLLQFGKSLIATVLFSSNFLFWSETGYFTAPAEFKPLLHTWSLAVEEQFYIGYPLLLLVIHRYFRPALVPTLWLGFLASLLVSVWGSIHTPGAAFYLAPTRAWELVLGALLALNAVPQLANKLMRNALSWLGIALIFWAVFLFTPETRFPGSAALLPCLGAGCIIFGGQRSSWNAGRLLSLRPVVALGLISYSLYLWHWPLIVFAKYYLVRGLTATEMTGLLLASLALAYASWRWVEQPFRKSGGVFERRGLFLAAGLAGLILILPSISVHYQHGWSNRFLESELQLLAQAKEHSPERLKCLDLSPQKVLEGDLCVVGERSNEPPTFLLWGDSHADAIMPALDKEARRASSWGYYAFYVSCPPLLGIENIWQPPSHACRAFNDSMLTFTLDRGIENIVLVAMWSNYPIGRIQEAASGKKDEASSKLAFETGLKRTMKALEADGRHVWLVEQVPMARHDVPRALAVSRRFGLSLEEIEPDYAGYASQQDFVDGVFNQVLVGANSHLINPAKILCNTRSCRVLEQGKSLYSDDDHLSEFGALWISDIFSPVFKKVDASESENSDHSKQ